MSSYAVDCAVWFDTLARLPREGVGRLLVVQCSLDWLRPGHLPLREEIDDLVVHYAVGHPGVRVDRLVLHSVPAAQTARRGDLATLNAAHAEWTYRLAVTAALLRHPNLRIHRLIVGGAQQHADVRDLVDVRTAGGWRDAPRSDAALGIITGGQRITPLTGYDLDWGGPFGDIDPSVHM
ncbi:hypothetical protein ACHZ98_15585 [Streptomyces sp. MAR4 CNY-716]